MEQAINNSPEASPEVERAFWASVIGTVAFVAVIVAYVL